MLKLDQLVTDTVGNIKLLEKINAEVASQRLSLIDLIQPGNNYAHPLAKVVITNQTETRTDSSHLIPTFNVEAYNCASDAEKLRLTKSKIVSLVPKTTKGQNPVCRITLVK